MLLMKWKIEIDIKAFLIGRNSVAASKFYRYLGGKSRSTFIDCELFFVFWFFLFHWHLMANLDRDHD